VGDLTNVLQPAPDEKPLDSKNVLELLASSNAGEPFPKQPRLKVASDRPQQRQ